MHSDVFYSLGFSLLMTLLLETLFALLLGIRNPRDLLLLLLVNGLTNPPVVLTYLVFPYAWVAVLLEISAVLLEGLLYRRCARSITHPMLFSLGANAFSFFSGLLLNCIA